MNLGQKLHFAKKYGDKNQALKKVRQFRRQSHKMPTNCLSVFNHFVILALKGLRIGIWFYSFYQIWSALNVEFFYSET